MTIEEKKARAAAEKEHLVIRITLYSNDYKPDDLRKKTLKQLHEIAKKLNLY